MSSVHQIEAPPDARALSRLDHIDYADAFLVDPSRPDELTPEEWARLILEGAPLSVRTTLMSGWSVLGLKLRSPGSDGSVLGWPVSRTASDHVLLGTGSRIGMPAELLLKRHGTGLLFCTFVQHDNLAARGVWAGVEPLHVPIVKRVLTEGLDRAEAGGCSRPPAALLS